MVDTLADWMLRHATAAHNLDIAVFGVIMAMFASCGLVLFFLPFESLEASFPRKSKARFWWRAAWIIWALGAADIFLKAYNHQRTSDVPDWVLIVSFLVVLSYAGFLGQWHHKEGKRTRPPE